MLRLGTMADLLNYVRYFKLNALIQCLWNLITRLERKLRLCFEKTDHDTRKMISIFRFIPSILLHEAKYLQSIPELEKQVNRTDNLDYSLYSDSRIRSIERSINHKRVHTLRAYSDQAY